MHDLRVEPRPAPADARLVSLRPLRRLGLMLLLASVGCAVFAAVAAGSPRAAVTRDLDADGRIDAIDLARRAGAVHVAGYRVTGRARRGLRLLLRERAAADSGARPRLRAGGRALRVRDGAAPVLAAAALRNGAPVLTWSEPVSTGRRAATLRLDSGSSHVDAALRVPHHAATSILATRLGALPARISAGRGISVLQDRSGNRARPFVRVTAPAPVYPVLPARAATAAESFADSVGVNVHLTYGDTAYGNFAAIRDALVDLGVRHLRDGACAGCTWTFRKYLALGELGMRFTLISGSPRNVTGTLAANLNSIKTTLLPAVAAVEGPNEYDASGDPNWLANLRAYQQELFSRVTADPQLRGLDVLGPSIVSGANRTLAGDMSAWMTHGNMHPYAGGRQPSATLSSELASVSQVSASRPVVATEGGYHTALATASGHRPVDEATAGVYVPAMFLENYRRGITRTFAYELIDEKPEAAGSNIEAHFGLLRNDFTPKPSYVALKGLLAAVGSGRPAHGPVPLRYDVTGGGGDLRQLLFQQRDGSYSLVLWRDVKVWDQVKRAPIAVPPAAVTVRLGQPVTRATVVRAGSTVAALDAPLEVPVALDAAPVVVRLVPVT